MKGSSGWRMVTTGNSDRRRLFLFRVYYKSSLETTVQKRNIKSVILGWKSLSVSRETPPLSSAMSSRDELNDTECQWQKQSWASPGLISIFIKFLPCPKPLNFFRFVLISFQSLVPWISANLAVWVLWHTMFFIFLCLFSDFNILKYLCIGVASNWSDLI